MWTVCAGVVPMVVFLCSCTPVTAVCCALSLCTLFQETPWTKARAMPRVRVRRKTPYSPLGRCRGSGGLCRDLHTFGVTAVLQRGHTGRASAVPQPGHVHTHAIARASASVASADGMLVTR